MRVVVLGQAVIHDPVEWPEELLAATAGADAVICNFEGCLAPDGAWPMKRKTVHPAHHEALRMLGELGVTHLALANNHAWDYGHAGIVITRRAAGAAGFAAAGTGTCLGEAASSAISNGVALISVDAGPTPDWAVAGLSSPGVNPLRMSRSLGLPEADIRRLSEIAGETGEAELRARRRAIGYDRPDKGAEFYGLRVEPADRPQEIWHCDENDFARLAEGIGSARKSADLAVVALHYHHWASDWSHPPDWLAPLARRIADAGADAIACTGPPFLYGLAMHGRSAIAPSLGNLVFHTARGGDYDRLGLPVWDGGMLVFDDGDWSLRRIDALRPQRSA